MRPKSPFLQNLRKKTPAPKMTSKKPSKTEATVVSSSRSSQPFKRVLFGEEEGRFQPFQLEKPTQSVETEEPKEPAIDLEKERRIAENRGYQKAKQEFEQYKVEAERLEKAFQEIASNMEESRHIWIREVREGVAESIQTALHHIVKNDNIQQSILAHQLAEALAHLAEEKEMKVTVAPEFVEFAREYLADKPRWTICSNEELHGGAMFESENGIWDARLKITLDEIDHLIQSWLVEKSGE